MNTEESFSNATYVDQMHIAEGELSAFISAVTQLFGPEQARLAAEDWLDESELADSRLDLQVEIGERSRSRPRLDWQIGSTSHASSIAARYLIRKYRRYHSLIVLPPGFWCDALIATDAIGNAQQKFFRKTAGTVL